MLEALETYVADARLGASALRFGDWLVEYFGSEIVELRRERERAAKELDEQSGRRESAATPDSSRGDRPTLPDPTFGQSLPPEAFPEHVPEALSLPSKTVEQAPKSVRPSKTVVFLLIVLFVAAGAVAALFFGHR
jgi:hypothetical protein